jgi:hypothetical protein
MKSVFVMLCDGAGNASDAIRADIRLDQTSPATAGFTVNDDAIYVMPDEDLVFDVDADDDTGGSGLRDFRVSFDDGVTWSDWYSLTGGSRVVVDRPALDDRLTATVVVRDVAGNEASAVTRSVHLVESSPRLPGPGSKFVGGLSDEADIDAIAVDVARGDALTFKLKVKPVGDDTVIEVALDLVTPDGTRLVEARLPDPTRKIKLSGFVAPASGRYYVVLHRTGGTATAGTYKLKTKVSQAPENEKVKGVTVGSTVSVEAAAGSFLKATLKAPGITTDTVSLVGPEGIIPIEVVQKDDKVKIRSTELFVGTGTWTVVIEGTTAVTYKVGVELAPRPPTDVLE